MGLQSFSFSYSVIPLLNLPVVLLKVSNANTEVEQVRVLNELSELIKNINFLEENYTVLAGDLYVFFDSKLETKVGKCSLKQKFLAKLLGLKEIYDLCDIWRVRNLTKNHILFGKTILLVL